MNFKYSEPFYFGFGDFVVLYLVGLVILFPIVPLKTFFIFGAVIFIAEICFLYFEKQYWKLLEIPSTDANIFFGNTLEVIMGGNIEYDERNIEKLGKTYGSFVFGRRMIETIDVELLRSILVKEFSHFSNRFFFPRSMNKNMRENSVFRNVITVLEGDDWKRVRNTVTPAFTTGKIKKLIPTLGESSKLLCKRIQKQYVEKDLEIPVKDLLSELVLDEIGRIGFSQDFHIFDSEQESPFVKNTRLIFGSRRYLFLLMAIVTSTPMFTKLIDKFFGLDIFRNPVEDFFVSFFGTLYEERISNPKKYENCIDIFQMLIRAVDEQNEAKSKEIANGTAKELVKMSDKNNFEDSTLDQDIIHSADVWKLSNENKMAGDEYRPGKKSISKIELISQAFVILIAGFDTTGSTLQYALYLLALNQDIQDRLRTEINSVLNDDNNNFTYEKMKEMHYLSQVVSETLRLYPIAPKMNRECTESITLSGIPFNLGDLVSFSIYAMHHNPEHYEDPERFDPDRFSTEQKALRDPLTYLPFGFGPRNCIGMRIAEFQVFVALAVLIRQFRFVTSASTPALPLKLQSFDLIRSIKPIFLKAENLSVN